MNIGRIFSFFKHDIVQPKSRKTFPWDILKWMKINANRKMTFKLMQCCKFFKHKEFPFPVLTDISIWHYLKCSEVGKKDSTKLYSLNDLTDMKENELFLMGKCELYLGFSQRQIFYAMCPKIAYFGIQELHLNWTDISMNEFQLLSGNGTIHFIRLVSSLITQNKGKIISLNDFFACLPNVETVEICRYTPSISCEKHVPNINLPKLKNFTLKTSGDTFSPAYMGFMLKHKHVSFTLGDFILGKYKDSEKFQNFTDNLLKKWPIDGVPFEMSFYEQTSKSKRAILYHKKLYEDYNAAGDLEKIWMMFKHFISFILLYCIHHFYN